MQQEKTCKASEKGPLGSCVNFDIVYYFLFSNWISTSTVTQCWGYNLMLHLKKKNAALRASTILLPLCMSVAPLSSKPVIGSFLLCIAIFLAATFVPGFKHWENLSVFLMVWLFGMPVNLRLILFILRFLELQSTLTAILYGAFIALLLFSVEEIVFGVFTRLIWRKQYKIVFD